MKPKNTKPVPLTIRLSTKGQLVVLKEIRERHGWSAGSELVFEDLGDKVVLREREVQDVPETRLDDLIGCTGYRGPARTLEEMEAGIALGARQHRNPRRVAEGSAHREALYSRG